MSINLSVTFLFASATFSATLLLFSATFRSYRNGKLEFEFTESSLDECNSNWHAFVRQFYYPISNSQRLSFYESLVELQLVLQDELNRLNDEFNRLVYLKDFNGGFK